MSTWVPSSSVLASSVVSFAIGSAKITTNTRKDREAEEQRTDGLPSEDLDPHRQSGRNMRYQLYACEAVIAL